MNEKLTKSEDFEFTETTIEILKGNPLVRFCFTANINTKENSSVYELFSENKGITGYDFFKELRNAVDKLEEQFNG